jgi:hypothetical protein
VAFLMHTEGISAREAIGRSLDEVGGINYIYMLLIRIRRN